MNSLNEQFTLQQWPRKLTELLQSKGWALQARYRAVKSGSPRQFAEVRLFESIGTDGQRRNLGLVNGYDLDKPTFDDSRFITDTSRLAVVGVGDGTKTSYEIPAGSVVAGSEKFYLDGAEVAAGAYSLNATTDRVTFTAAPGTGVLIKMTGSLSSRAFEPTNTFSLFTYNDIYFDKAVVRPSADANLGTANGTKTAFNLPKFPVRVGTLKVYVAGTEVSDTTYTVDFATGVVTFLTAPATGAVEAEYRHLVTPVSGVDYGDITVTVTETDPLLPKTAVSMAYAAFSFLQPSLPTVMSMTDDTNLSRSFNRDSYLYLWGNVNKDRIILFFRADPSADPVKSFYLPLYFGRLHVVGSQPRRNTVLIGGAKTGAPVAYAANQKLGNTLVDYGPQTSNGNDTVQLHQTIGGSLYQKHYLSFITHDRAIDTASTKFNPSAYTGKYHVSPVSIVHPQEGYVGKLDDVYAVHPKNIEQMDELEIEKTVVHEVIGEGDGVRKVFHIEHQCKEAQPLLFGDCVEITTGWTYDAEHKAVIFDNPPASGIEVTANYNFNQLFKYSLATTPRTATRLDDVTPFNPIGFGIFKENIV